ncbi:hypothetical protein ACFQZ4_47945 [Catellatospora coxensis]
MTIRARLVPYSLVALSLIPVVAGAFRVTELAAGALIDDGNARFFASPVPVVLHIVGATVYCLVGAFQFDAVLRRRRPGGTGSPGGCSSPAAWSPRCPGSGWRSPTTCRRSTASG